MLIDPQMAIVDRSVRQRPNDRRLLLANLRHCLHQETDEPEGQVHVLRADRPSAQHPQEDLRDPQRRGLQVRSQGVGY